MSESGDSSPKPPQHRVMTVAQVQEPPGGEPVRVAFFQSARFYWLPRSNPAFTRILNLLHDSREGGRALKVRLASPESDVIEDVG